MNDRDCESCKKFSRTDPHESEGYCGAKRTWVDPQEGEDCKMHEFTLWTADKYKDGTPIMTEPEKIYCETDSALIHGDTDSYEVRKAAKNSMYGKTAQEVLSNQLDSLEQRVDELSEEYDTVLKTHSDTLEKYKERITNNEGDTDAISYDVENLQTKVAEIEQRIDKLTEDYDTALAKYASKFKGKINEHLDRIDDLDTVLATHAGKINAHGDMLEEHLDRICNLEHLYEQLISRLCDAESHNGSDFCGNCVHVNKCRAEDGIYACELSGEIIDPDSASCSMFEPPF